jgi:hypothetical protein
MSDSTIYMDATDNATILGGQVGEWLYDHGAPIGSRWRSLGNLPDGGRIWIRREPGDFIEQVDAATVSI